VDFLDDAAVHVEQFGYGAVFVIVMLESAGIPMPGETVLVTAAVYAGTKMRWIRYVIAAAAGAILGDNIGFWVGRSTNRCLKNGAILLGLMPERGCLVGIFSPVAVARSCSSGASLRCAASLPP
jgi:hypothetical protein